MTLPEDLSYIETCGFSNCRYLEKINLPKSLASIGINPFRYEKLSEFSISEENDYMSISNGALVNEKENRIYSMPLLTVGEYKVEDGIETISRQAFVKQCMIHTLYLPTTINLIDREAFMECISIKNLYVEATVPPEISSDAFPENVYENCIVYVPRGSKSDYENSDWSVFHNIVEQDIETGINLVPSDYLYDKIIYNLNGIRVNNEDLTNGIYIVRHANGNVAKIRILN